MQYKYQSLQNQDPQFIFEAFRSSFAEYYVPIDFTSETHFQRWQNAGVNLRLSWGAFSGSQLCGFILNCPEGPELFNLATGVVPAHRGRGLVQGMYQHIKSTALAQGLKRLTLEVISINHPAIAAYTRVGFEISKTLNCYQGVLPELFPETLLESDYKVSALSLPDSELLSLAPYGPAFEQSWKKLIKRSHELELHQLFVSGELVAYGIFWPEKMNLIQFNASESFNVTAATLFKHMNLNGKKIGILNIDQRNKRIIQFLEKMELKNTINQYEMVLDL